ncbi:tRNA (guanine-N(1)-)-methyltransferase [Alphaproteobacteria bacterium]|nr:tRNA (guanine-N(1)-)-methyltransferase [Alphaproteobacteria bacterium]
MTFPVRVLTLYPEMFPGPLALSIAGRALAADIWSILSFNIRDFATDRHGTVDDAPFGGGAGMVMKPDVLDAAIAAHGQGRLVFPTPQGAPFTQAVAAELAAAPGGLTFICGHFEGVDRRVIDKWAPLEVSLGDFVLSGGELATMAMLDSVVRLLPGALGSEESLAQESFNSGLLEHFHYTRPRLWQGREAPAVLLSGDHAKVAAWRMAEMQRLTRERRPDLWQAWTKTAADKQDQKDGTTL